MLGKRKRVQTEEKYEVSLSFPGAVSELSKGPSQPCRTSHIGRASVLATLSGCTLFLTPKYIMYHHHATNMWKSRISSKAFSCASLYV
jgi:hypothetical protein